MFVFLVWYTFIQDLFSCYYLGGDLVLFVFHIKNINSQKNKLFYDIFLYCHVKWVVQYLVY